MKKAKQSKDLARGAKIEMEHTKSKKAAKKIAKTHLKESPLYYDEKVGLPAMERKLKKMKGGCSKCGKAKCKCGE
jgi:hypothetical protein